MGKAKDVHAKPTRRSFPASCGWAGVQPSPGEQGSNTLSGDSKCPPPLLLPPLYLLSMMSHGLEYPWGQLWSLVLAVSPPSLPHTPSPSPAWLHEGQKRPWLCANSVTTQTSVLSTLCLAQPQTSCWEGN